MYSPILTTLETVISSDGWDSKAKTEAQGLLSSITSSNFIVAFSVHFHLMGYTKQLSVSLQGKVWPGLMESGNDFGIVLVFVL